MEVACAAPSGLFGGSATPRDARPAQPRRRRDSLFIDETMFSLQPTAVKFSILNSQFSLLVKTRDRSDFGRPLACSQFSVGTKLMKALCVTLVSHVVAHSRSNYRALHRCVVRSPCLRIRKITKTEQQRTFSHFRKLQPATLECLFCSHYCACKF